LFNASIGEDAALTLIEAGDMLGFGDSEGRLTRFADPAR